MKGLMVSAMVSGGGKTTLTCALMAALQSRGVRVQGFKCGPDYIDPMFHTRVLGVESRNLDLFLQGEEGVHQTYARAAQQDSLALVEGVMGFYDGAGGTDHASTWSVAHCLDLPVVLALRPKGASLTLAAQVKGLMGFRRPSHIAALILTDCTPALYAHLTPILEKETGLKVLGYLPSMEQARWPARHLGLMTADEISDFALRVSDLGRQVEQTVDLERLLALAGGERGKAPTTAVQEPKCTIGVAKDEAFCFYYADNLAALERAGAKLTFFSPIRDTPPEQPVHGLYLGGGYPELYAQALSQNTMMRAWIKDRVTSGVPTVAECGGFLYLQNTLEDVDKVPWPMCSALHGAGVKGDRLQRFGYANLTANQDSLLLRAGETVPAHEFHYWDCTENGGDLYTEKPFSSRKWRCGILTPTLYAGFPHLHFGGKLPLAQRFVEKAHHWRGMNG